MSYCIRLWKLLCHYLEFIIAIIIYNDEAKFVSSFFKFIYSSFALAYLHGFRIAYCLQCIQLQWNCECRSICWISFRRILVDRMKLHRIQFRNFLTLAISLIIIITITISAFMWLQFNTIVIQCKFVFSIHNNLNMKCDCKKASDFYEMWFYEMSRHCAGVRRPAV